MSILKKPHFLIGFMASGKSTYARLLDPNAIDLDEMIVEKAALSISQIFERYGEDYFRFIEAQLLRSIPIQSKNYIAVGGGCPMYYQNMAWMNQNGITFYLRHDFERLYNRIHSDKDRPLAKILSKEELEKLFINRKKLYLLATEVIEMTDDVSENLNKIK